MTVENGVVTGDASAQEASLPRSPNGSDRQDKMTTPNEKKSAAQLTPFKPLGSVSKEKV
jgi:hypothetical protein